MDDADAFRQSGQRALALLCKQTLRLQLSLYLLKGKLQRAEALRLHRFHHELNLTARIVKVDAAAGKHGHTILRLELHIAGRHLCSTRH